MPGGDAVFPALNRAAQVAPLVVASRDWHPADHVSFQARGGPWPVHCQAGTRGAEFHPDLDRRRIEKVVSKGVDRDREAYSAFDGTELAGWLREHQVHRLLVGGLATDYCVRASVLDARQEGFEVMVLEDGFSWNGQKHDSLSAIAHRITGTRWSGPRFFGLRQNRKS